MKLVLLLCLLSASAILGKPLKSSDIQAKLKELIAAIEDEDHSSPDDVDDEQEQQPDHGSEDPEDSNEEPEEESDESEDEDGSEPEGHSTNSDWKLTSVCGDVL